MIWPPVKVQGSVYSTQIKHVSNKSSVSIQINQNTHKKKIIQQQQLGEQTNILLINIWFYGQIHCRRIRITITIFISLVCEHKECDSSFTLSAVYMDINTAKNKDDKVNKD